MSNGPDIPSHAYDLTSISAPCFPTPESGSANPPPSQGSPWSNLTSRLPHFPPAFEDSRSWLSIGTPSPTLLGVAPNNATQYDLYDSPNGPPYGPNGWSGTSNSPYHQVDMELSFSTPESGSVRHPLSQDSPWSTPSRLPSALEDGLSSLSIGTSSPTPLAASPNNATRYGPYDSPNGPSYRPNGRSHMSDSPYHQGDMSPGGSYADRGHGHASNDSFNDDGLF